MSKHDPLCPQRERDRDNDPPWAHEWHAMELALAHAEAVAAKLVEVICEQEAQRMVDSEYARGLREHYENLVAAREAERDVFKRRAEHLATSHAATLDVIAADMAESQIATLRAERDAARAELAEIDARVYGAQGIHRRNYVAERDLKAARAELARAVDALEVATRQRSVAMAVAERAEASRERIRVEMEQKVIDAHREVALARAEVAALHVLVQDASDAFAAGRREVLADLRAKVEGLHDSQHFPWLPKRGTTDCGCPVGAVLALIEEAQHD